MKFQVIETAYGSCPICGWVFFGSHRLRPVDKDWMSNVAKVGKYATIRMYRPGEQHPKINWEPCPHDRKQMLAHKRKYGDNPAPVTQAEQPQNSLF